jgi:hypothetical protein
MLELKAAEPVADMQKLTLAAVRRDRVIPCMWYVQNLTRSAPQRTNVRLCTS